MALPAVKLLLNATFTVPVFVDGLVTVMTWQLMVRLYEALTPKQPFASVALTVIWNVPVWVGVPERTPALGWEDPAGSTPLLSVNVTGAMALPAVKLWLKGTFTVPVFVAGLVTVMTWQLTVSVYVPPTAVQPFASVTLTVIENEPICVGVPERTPAL